MELIVEHLSGEAWFHEIMAPGQIVPSFEGTMYTCILVVVDPVLADTCREEVARHLVDTGCRSATCVGVGCHAWETAIDLAYVDKSLDHGVDIEGDGAFLSTSSHARRQLQDALFHGLMCMAFPVDPPCRHFLVLCIGSGQGLRQEVLRGIKQAWV